MDYATRRRRVSLARHARRPRVVSPICWPALLKAGLLTLVLRREPLANLRPATRRAFFRSRLASPDDPGPKTFHNKSLIGSYSIGDEGVPAQKVTLVDNGKLTSYFMSREPIRDFPDSNGHGRAGSGQGPGTSISVLQIQATHPLSQAALVKKMIDMGEDADLSDVYLVETLGGASHPRTLVRNKVADGSRQAVRGAQLGDLYLRSFRAGHPCSRRRTLRL